MLRSIFAIDDYALIDRYFQPIFPNLRDGEKKRQDEAGNTGGICPIYLVQSSDQGIHTTTTMTISQSYPNTGMT